MSVIVIADDGWLAGGNKLENCLDFADAAAGITLLNSQQKTQLHSKLDQLNDYRAGMLRDALTFVVSEKITNPFTAENIALSRCSGHKKYGPTLWQWNTDVGWTGPY